MLKQAFLQVFKAFFLADDFRYRLTDQGYELAHRLEEAERRQAAGDHHGRGEPGEGGSGPGEGGGSTAGVRGGDQSPQAETATG